jgi:hypothetical protein
LSSNVNTQHVDLKNFHKENIKKVKIEKFFIFRYREKKKKASKHNFPFQKECKELFCAFTTFQFQFGNLMTNEKGNFCYAFDEGKKGLRFTRKKETQSRVKNKEIIKEKFPFLVLQTNKEKRRKKKRRKIFQFVPISIFKLHFLYISHL